MQCFSPKRIVSCQSTVRLDLVWTIYVALRTVNGRFIFNETVSSRSRSISYLLAVFLRWNCLRNAQRIHPSLMQTRMLLTKRAFSPELPCLRRTHSPFAGTGSLRWASTPHHKPTWILLTLALLLYRFLLNLILPILTVISVHRKIARCHIYFYFSLLFFY
jgi:hypothetical protein